MPDSNRSPAVSAHNQAFGMLLVILLAMCFMHSADAAGTWTPLANKAPGKVFRVLLQTDGTVFAQNDQSDCFRLTPSASGSYVNGTWSLIAQMIDTRLYYASQVLKDGRIFVAGGEYGSGQSNAEVYNPLLNTWTATPPAGVGFSDAVSETLPNGNVLIAPVIESNAGKTTLIYDIVSNTWSNGPLALVDQNEVPWVKLPGGSIITPDSNNKTSERYDPISNGWVNDGPLPVQMYDKKSLETGSGLLLPNGNVFFLGYTHTAIYTPGVSGAAGIWLRGPDIPNKMNCGDTPSAMMVNGKVLCLTATGLLKGNTSFFEYDYVANAFTSIDGPTGPAFIGLPYVNTFLDLPDGSVLMTNGTNQLYQYVPDGAPLAAGKPAISGITHNADGSYHLTGTLLNGISEGSTYGDDVQTATNYPIIRLSDGSNVLYARTYNWSSTDVMTGSTMQSTDFTLPLGLPAGVYAIEVTANGIASIPLAFTVPFDPNDAAPTVAVPAAASEDFVTGTRASLSVLGDDADGGGEANLIYTWTATALPDGALQPSFADNGTNSAKNTTAIFSAVGSYTLTATITDSSGLSVSSSVNFKLLDIPPVLVSPLNVSTPVNAFFSYEIKLKMTGFPDASLDVTNLPQGLSMYDAVISGTPTAMGPFAVQITAQNSAGTDVETLIINVTPPSSKTLIDSDGDGFPDELETYLGTDPLNPNDTPFKGAPANPIKISVSSLQIRLNFARVSRETLSVMGALPLSGDYLSKDQVVTVDVGGVIASFVLSPQGMSMGLKSSHFKLGTKSVHGSVPFSVTISDPLLGTYLDDEGLVNLNVTQSVSIPIVILFNGNYYTSTVTQNYIGKKDVSGKCGK